MDTLSVAYATGLHVTLHDEWKRMEELCSSGLSDDSKTRNSLKEILHIVRVENAKAARLTNRPIADIAEERRRQIEAEGWSDEHDDAHDRGELARAAACYALEHCEPTEIGKPFWFWPFHRSWWKPRSAREDLVRAALIAAEIDRLDRLAARETIDG